MATNRLTLIHFDVLRELCDQCRRERFHFVPTGGSATAGTCGACGAEAKLADVTDTGVWRLLSTDREVVVG